MREFRLEMRAAAFVALQRPFQNRLGHREHVEQRFGEDDVLVRPVAGVGKRAAIGPLFELANLTVRFVEHVVVPHDRGGLGHHLAQFLMNEIRILAAAGAG